MMDVSLTLLAGGDGGQKIPFPYLNCAARSGHRCRAEQTTNRQHKTQTTTLNTDHKHKTELKAIKLAEAEDQQIIGEESHPHHTS